MEVKFFLLSDNVALLQGQNGTMAVRYILIGCEAVWMILYERYFFVLFVY